MTGWVASPHDARVPDESTLFDVSSAGATGDGPRVSLVVYFGDHAEVIALAPEAPVVIGRSAPADIVVPASKLSRRHARFTRSGEGVRVEDLGSTNGTRYRGEKIKDRVLMPGDVVRLGPVSVSVHRTDGPGPLLSGVEPYEQLVTRIEDEILRARTFMRSCALMMVRAAGADHVHAGTWIPRLRALLRPIDRITIYGENAVLVLLPETDPDRAAQVAAQVAALDPRLHVGVALGAGTAEELIDDARAVAREVPRDSRIRIAVDDPRPMSGEPVFKSPNMVALSQLVDRVARAKIPVLVTGETGSGKEVIARAIHERGPRADGPMRIVNCGAMAASLLESTLFGHEKGAFTGADRDRAGLFEQASGGTLFLDEVGELSPAAQVALLRVLETHEVVRLGGSRDIEVDVRVVAATNRDLEAEVSKGAFREDLLFRLNPMTLRLPPLRERPDDLDPLIDRFLAEALSGTGLSSKTLDDDARACLHAYSWPGNVRELRNVIERAVVVCLGDVIGTADLPEKLIDVGAPRPSANDGSTPEPEAEEGGDFKTRVRNFETRLIVDALRRTDGNQTAAAKLLRMPLRTLVHKIKTYSIRV